MKIVTTFHQPSSVLASIKCQLSSRDLEHLVVAKSNRIDVYAMQRHGLQHQCGLELRGTVASLRSVPISGSSRSNLLLLLDHPDPELIFLSYTENASSGSKLTVTKQLLLYERTPQPAEFFTDVVVHPSGRVAVVSCYKGKLRVVKLKAGNHDEDFDVVLRELNLLGLEFLPLPEDDYALAILHVDYRERVQLLARDISLEDLELSTPSSAILTPTTIAEKLLPDSDALGLKLLPVSPQYNEDSDLEQFLGGILVIGARKILLYELASTRVQEKQTSKRRRLDSKKKSTDIAQVEIARAKEEERDGRVRKNQGSVEWPWSQVTAAVAVDPSVPRFIIGDIFGRLSLLSLENLKADGLILIPLGEVSPPSSLTYLTSQIIYLGSHLGDSQLLQLSPTAVSSLDSPTLPIPADVKTISSASLGRPSRSKGKGRAIGEQDNTKGAVVESKGSFINVLENFRNIAPIVDAIVIDPDGSGERQVVTCSGGGNRGSLNVVRSGAGFEELASIPGFADIANVWTIRDEWNDSHDSHLLVSTLRSTHLLRFTHTNGDTSLAYVNDTGLTDNSGFVTDVPTLAFSNVMRPADSSAAHHNSQLVVQVTKKGARLLEYDTISGTFNAISGFDQEGSEVVAADINSSQVFLAFKGGRLLCLVIDSKGFRVSMDNSLTKKLDHDLQEISSISCAPLDPSKPYTNYLVVSYWDSKAVQVFTFNAQGFVPCAKTHPLPAIARSLLLYDFSPKGEDHRYYLLAGLADGSVAYFSWQDRKLGDGKIIPLGHSPVSLTACQIDGKRSIFAAGNRATVFSWEKKGLHNSPIVIRDVVAAAPLNTVSFKSSLVLATPTALFIGRVKELDKMHIRKISLGLDNPTRVVYEHSNKVFGVVIYRTEPNRIGDGQYTTTSFRLLDSLTFNTLATFNCLESERISAVATYSPEIDGRTNPVFCIGVFKDTDAVEPDEGRLVILSAGSAEGRSKIPNLQLSAVASADVKGCVYAISFIKDVVIATVNSAVMAFKLRSTGDTFVLELLSEWNHNYLLTSLSTYDDRIVIGDQLNSVSLLEMADGKISNIARDYGPRWPVAVESLDRDAIIGANLDANLMTFKMTQTLQRPSLECDGNYHLGECVTKFVRGSLTSESSKNVGLGVTHAFFTSSGRIGVIVDVTEPTLSLHLTALQRNLVSAIPGVGGESHTRYRAPKSNKGRSDADIAAFGFIDGDFVEQFLTYLGSESDVEKIIAGQSDPERLTMPINEIQAVLENLQGFH